MGFGKAGRSKEKTAGGLTTVEIGSACTQTHRHCIICLRTPAANPKMISTGES